MTSTARILVVDDERGIREGCRKALSSEGHQVETAEDGAAALQMVRSGAFDLLLVDVKMPGLGGISLVQRVQEIDPAIMCVMITGYATLETAIEATKSGAYDFLPKPFTPDELAAKVEKALDRRRLLLETRRLQEEQERSLLQISVQKSRLLTVINCMQEGVLVINRDGQLVLHNPAAVSMLQPASPFIGAPVAECISQAQLAELLTSTLSGTTGPGEMLSQEIPSPDGSRVLMASVAPVRDDLSETLGAVAVLRDITELKRLERVKSQFVAMVAHELRAPLAAIQGYMDVMLTGAAGDDPGQLRHMLERSKARTMALINLIDDLLDVSSIEAGRIARRIERIQIPNLLLDVVETVRPQAESRDISISEKLPGNLPPVLADREDMVRLFTNLLTNAIKYNKQGGEIRLVGQVEDRYLRVDVADTGIGMPEECIPKIFDEFYRVKIPETRQITGTGLGLSIVKKILEAHHGRVEVSSELGKGSTFSIFLPTAD
jgi:PAS domain S-box-containing protein